MIKSGNSDVIVGLQWGDEGKGRVVDYLSSSFDVIVRYQGGANAGHTVVVGDKKFIFHLLPSGMLYEGKVCVIGNGVVFDPEQFFKELEEVGEAKSEIYVSGCAHVVMPYHKLLDGAEERFRGGNNIGTTKRGIGPCYSDKYARLGIRVADLCEPTVFKEKLEFVLSLKNKILGSVYNIKPLDFSEIYEKYVEYGSRLKKYVADTSLIVNKAIDAGEDVLFEGAQGVLLDVDFGTYPYVTSSNPVSGGVCTGVGIPPIKIKRIIGVVKAYSTRVGAGPFPTELLDKTGEILRERGQEYGATTGRPRRCGWLDLVALRYAVRVTGTKCISLTKLDVLSGIPEIKVCVAYKSKGKIYNEFLPYPHFLEDVEPIYETLPGWEGDLSECKVFDDLPPAARRYVDYIQTELDVDVALIGVGPSRQETIIIPGVI